MFTLSYQHNPIPQNPSCQHVLLETNKTVSNSLNLADTPTSILTIIALHDN